MTTYTTAAEAIARSISHDVIARCERTEANLDDLFVSCDEWTEGNDEYEFWGDDRGNTWRVHVAKD